MTLSPRALSAAFLTVSLVLGGGAALAAVNAKSVTESRQANFKTMGKSMKAMTDGLKAGSPDMTAIAANAATLRGLAPKISTWFPKGTGPESGVKTEALAEIWNIIIARSTAARISPQLIRPRNAIYWHSSRSRGSSFSFRHERSPDG